MIRFETSPRPTRDQRSRCRTSPFDIDKGGFVLPRRRVRIVERPPSSPPSARRTARHGQILEAAADIGGSWPKCGCRTCVAHSAASSRISASCRTRACSEKRGLSPSTVIGRPRHVVGHQVAQVRDLVGLGQQAGQPAGRNSRVGGSSVSLSGPPPSSTGPSFCWRTSPRETSTPDEQGIMQLLTASPDRPTTVVVATHDESWWTNAPACH